MCAAIKNQWRRMLIGQYFTLLNSKGKKTAEEAKAFVKELKQQKRYQRDVY